MEEQFLTMLNFNCYIGEATLKSYLERLEMFALVNASSENWSLFKFVYSFLDLFQR